MASVPGIFYVGSYHIQGGVPTIDAVGREPLIVNDFPLQSELNQFKDRDTLRIVPDDPDDGSPIADSIECWPWYDKAAPITIYQVASSTTTTVTVSPSPGWTTNEWAGRTCTLLNTPPIDTFGFKDRLPIVSNTADTLTFEYAVPSGAPAVGQSFFPGVGRFTDYHAVAGATHISEIGSPSTRGGGSVDQGGAGVGPDATMVLELYKNVFPVAPYFHMWKWATVTTVNQGFGDAPNNTFRVFVEDELVRVTAAAAARGNTIDWQYAIIDFSMNDVELAISDPPSILQYETRLRQMIAWLRSSAALNNATLKVILISHRSDLRAIGAPGGAAYTRGVHSNIAADTDGVAILDCEGYRVSGVGLAETEEKQYYAQAEYFRMGKELARTIQRLANGDPVASEGGFPVYLMLGDSIWVGEATSTWTLNSNSPSISGPTPGFLLRPDNQKVWNRGSSVLEVYLPHTNSNTSGSITGTAGPDLSIMAELGDLHPDGFALIKRAAFGAGMAEGAGDYDSGTGNGGRWIKSAEEHYPELQADFAGAVAYINEVIGKQADMRGAFVSLGHNDNQAPSGTGGTSFAAFIRSFCNDLWADFSTRTSGRKFPIVWRRPQPDAFSADPVRIAQVRAALEAQANRESQFRVVDVDGLERDRDDNLHETPETAVTTGRRMVVALRRVAI